MKTPQLLPSVLVSVVLASAGCGQKAPPAAGSDVAAPPAPSMPSLAAEPSTPPPPAGAQPPALSGASPPGQVVAASAAAAPAEVTLEDEDGNPIKDSLQIMQRAVEMYDEHRFSSVSEETDQPWPPLKDLSQLVQYKILPRLPPPPAGKRWVLDATRKTVSLKSQ